MKIALFLEKVCLFIIVTSVPLAFPYEFKELLFINLITFWTFLFLINTFISRYVPVPQNRLTYGVLLFAVITLISFLLSDFKIMGSIRMELIFCFIVFSFLVSQIIIEKKLLQSLLTTVSFTGFIISCYGIVQSFGIDFVQYEDLSRVFATLGHPNFLGSYLLAIIPVTLGLLFTSKTYSARYGYLVSITAQFICLFLTLSRASSAIAIFILILFSIHYLKKNQPAISIQSAKKILIALFLIGSLGLTIFFVRATDVEVSRLTNVFTPSKMNTLWMRLLAWKGAAGIIKKSPVLGNGPGTFSIYVPINHPPEFKSVLTERDEYLHHAHNEYLELWCESGILGPIIFAYIVVAAIFYGFRLIRGNKDKNTYLFLGVTYGLVGLCIDMLFSVSMRFVTVPFIFWFYTGIINAAINRKIEAKTKSSIKLKKVFLIFLSGFVFVYLLFISENAFKRYVAKAYFNKGTINYEAGNINDAYKFMQSALGIDKNIPEIYYKKGSVEVRLKKWTEALTTFKALDKIHPNFIHINFNLSLCYLNLGDLKNAIIYGKRQIGMYPDFGKQYYISGRAHYLEKNYEKAEKYFKKYLEYNPRSAGARNYLERIKAFRSESNN
jgi:O-antigen ligase